MNEIDDNLIGLYNNGHDIDDDDDEWKVEEDLFVVFIITIIIINNKYNNNELIDMVKRIMNINKAIFYRYTKKEINANKQI